ncbi:MULTISPECIES: hypothetical protein [Methanobacterium]|uniref:Uncharacterized protein n=1 Tax=Methanobacterium veterum TaxID=408577 RepID=A0A9E4ZYA0_9EURY|nr:MULTISPECIES: hypothetical protein [Methanobacterium]MCZ3365658.1 hypothetical protein [Methanobacterium veterum]MCZ3371122.1 hypothetical protein [Methanobacterium veterum]
METFLDQARKGKTSLIRYIIGIFIIYFFIYIVGAAVQFIVAMAFGSSVNLGTLNISSITRWPILWLPCVLQFVE